MGMMISVYPWKPVSSMWYSASSFRSNTVLFGILVLSCVIAEFRPKIPVCLLGGTRSKELRVSASRSATTRLRLTLLGVLSWLKTRRSIRLSPSSPRRTSEAVLRRVKSSPFCASSHMLFSAVHPLISFLEYKWTGVSFFVCSLASSLSR